MHNKFFDTITKHNMLSKTEDVVVAVSGGSDSVCMLLLFMEFYGNTYKDHIICAHFNHMIRGAESDSDEELVRNLCEKYGLRFVRGSGNIPAQAREQGLGLEECARLMRYDFLQNVSKENGNIKIAVAHNKNDNVETILGNIARGASISGLKGISYCRNNIIRPLMDYSKNEIDLICINAGISVAKDSTNSDNNYKRNNIRNIVLPFLREHLSDGIDDKILSLSESAIIDNDYIEEQVSSAFTKCVSNQTEDLSCITIDLNVFNSFHSAIKHRIVRKCLASLHTSGKLVFPEYVNIDKKAVLRITEGLEKKQTGKRYDALCGVVCTIQYDKAYFTTAPLNDSDEQKKLVYEVTQVSASELSEFLKDKQPDTEYFDYRKLCDYFGDTFKINYRYSEEGDSFHPFGAQGSKLLRKFYIDAKIPVSKRRTKKIVCINNQVIWIPEIRRSDVAKIDETTVYVLKFKVI